MPVTLDQQSLLELDKARRLMDEADELLRKMVACGYDCQAQQMLSMALRQRIDALRHEFAAPRKE